MFAAAGTAWAPGAGETVRIKFEAGLEGVFEVELHELGERVGELTVNP